MSAIFLSYRRDDSSGYAGRLFDNLVERFEREQVFMDIETLEPGMDFVDGIDLAIESCGAVIALIGPNWLGATDGDGRRRVDDPHDFIRLEIKSALQRGVRIIPVLVRNARMPPEDELPESLHPLCRLQACELSDNRWEFDVHRLIDVLEPLVADPAPVATPSGTQTDTGLSDPSKSPSAETKRAMPFGPLAVLVLGIAIGAGWWFTRQVTVAPPAPIQVAEPSSAPQDEVVVTAPSPPPEPAPTPVRDAEPEPTPIVDAEDRSTVPAPTRPIEPPAEIPSAEVRARQARVRAIEALLARAETDLAELRLSRPAGDNALERYRQVLELDPGNPDAQRGLVAISERYRGLVEDALRRGAFDTAGRHLISARAIDPNAGWLAPLQEEIRRQRDRASETRPPVAAAPDRADTRQTGPKSCLAECEHRHKTCEETVESDAEATCVRDRVAVCEKRYQSCMDDSNTVFILGRVAHESECAGAHVRCERAAAVDCVDASRSTTALCNHRLEQCQLGCRSGQ